MKDPSLAIREAYIAKLDLTLNGQTVPVYDRVPDNAKEPYVVISEQTGTDDSGKGCYGMDTTILLDIVTRYKKGGGKKDADIISNQIMEIIIKENDLPDASPDFKIYGVILENINNLESLEPSNYTVRKLIRIRNLVQQLN